MKRFAILLLLFAGSVSAAPRFVALDIFIDADQPVAAWQFELRETNGIMTVVGLENGDSAAFGDAPYYDRDAVAAGNAAKIIVADFSLQDDDRLPVGSTRIATVHVMLESGEPEYELQLITATTRSGQRIDASISVREHEGSRP